MDEVQHLGPMQLLLMWERVQGLPPHRQAVELLAAGEPGLTPEAIAALSVGARDARLLRLRERLFGPRLKSLADCPSCGERIEMGFRVEDIRAAATASAVQADGGEAMLLKEGGWRIRFRLPTAADLAETADRSDLDSARRSLLQRCVLALDLDGDGEVTQGDTRGMDLDGLPPDVVGRIVEAMSEADPQADVELLLSCPACGHQWRARFDIVSYLVTEIDAWAQRILADVARLARGYGWSESAILAMTPARRHAYLELLEGA